MYLKDQDSGDFVEVCDLASLIDPNRDTITGRFHVGEELQEEQPFAKGMLVFPSGELLPRCWIDPHWRE